ncbi:MAG: hypothetical protein ISR98_01545 [Parcubacteria group bacterium]|nr:hypothetical protein [Parcubacteria group bacterium]
MQKTLTKILILAFVLTTALGVNYLFAAWVGPTQDPTGGNTAQPVHIGTTDQVKDGGLSLDGLSVFGGGYFQGNVGVGVVTPTEALDVDGGIKVGNSTNANAGTIRWTGTDLEVYNGSAWASLTSGEEAPPAEDPNYTDCINAGGSWVDAISTCYVPGTSCPSGWTPNANYSSTRSNSCSGDCSSCSTGSHVRVNAGIESCTYYSANWGWEETRQGGLIWTRNCGNQNRSGAGCSAVKTEIGCIKN